MRFPLICAALALAACTPSPDRWDTHTFDQAAASQPGGFGSATAQNEAAMRGQYRVALAHRFAQEVPSTVNFAFNSAALSAEAQQILRRQADWIRQFPELKFKVFGHTDLVGSASYNRQLGLRRARAVANFLQAQGISGARLLAVVSEGESQPLIVTRGREPRNRRTVTEVSGFFERRTGALNGKYAEIIMREYVGSAESTPELQGGAFAPGMTGADG